MGQMWFGTLERQGWMRAPMPGADSSPESWDAGGVLLNGGGYQMGSFGSHKTYTYEWPSSCTREEAQLLKSYADGTYGRGLIYFVDPLIYNQNILPARWADPSMAIGYDGRSHVSGVEPMPVVTANADLRDLPFISAKYDLGNVAPNFRGYEDAVYIPIPLGYKLLLSAFYTSTGSGAVLVAPHTSSFSAPGTATKIYELGHTVPSIFWDRFTGVPGVWLWLGKTAAGAATVTVAGIMARLVSLLDVPAVAPPSFYGYGGTPAYGYSNYGGFEEEHTNYSWTGGMGHSGVRFMGKPTFQSNSGTNGGQIGFSASFREVGDTAYG